jgi:hypothetical protein
VIEVSPFSIRNFYLSAVFTYFVVPASESHETKQFLFIVSALVAALDDLLVASQKLQPRSSPAHLFN